MITALTNHLWQSTLFAVVVALLAVTLRRNKAQVRYWLWLTASLKFFIPFSLLVGLGQQLQSVPAAQQLATQIATPTISNTIVQVTQPFPGVLPAVLPQAPAVLPAAADRVPMLLLGVWIAGFGAIALMRVRAWRRVQLAVLSSVPLESETRLKVRTSSGLFEPGVVGLWRPVLLLPAALLDSLTPHQLEAVLAHELCHVKRRDNFTSAIHMLVEAIFWFHPVVWWIGARLVQERELACDEEVLRLGNEPLAYAEGILNVCKVYQESPLACVSGVTGSDLKRRIENIMRNRGTLEMSFGKLALLVVAALLIVVGPIAAGVVHPLKVAAAIREAVSPVTPAAEPAMPIPPVRTPLSPSPAPQAVDKFEVVSIRAAEPGAGGGGGGPRGGGGGQRGGGPGRLTPCGIAGPPLTPGRLTLRNTSVFSVITLAYGKNCRAANEIGLISGLPDWVATQGFDIQATLPAGTPAYSMQQLQNGEAPRLQAMLQDMLADRFHLTLHRSSKEAALYNLVFVRDGKIKLSVDQTPPPPPPQITGPPDPTAPPPSFPRGGFRLNVDPPAGIVHIEASSVPISTLVNIFQGQEAHFVIDKTGMKGLYDIPAVDLNVGPYDVAPGAVSVWPEIMQQLGLKLESARGPLETLVIDRLDKPTEN